MLDHEIQEPVEVADQAPEVECECPDFCLLDHDN